MADNKSREIGELKVKVNVEIADALTGLKAITREARKAKQALAELAQPKGKYGIKITDLHNRKYYLLLEENSDQYETFATFEDADDFNFEFSQTLEDLLTSEVVEIDE
jgi:hypothetical protein